MKHKIPLTKSQIKYIRDNYQELTMCQLTVDLDLPSKYKIQVYMEENGLKKPANDLTEDQKEFVRENHKYFTEANFQRKFGLSNKWLIQKFKRKEGITIYTASVVKKPKHEVIKGNFDVSERWNWAI